MRIWYGLERIHEPFESISLAIGVFDGIHVGHQALIRLAVDDSRKNKRRSAVLTFNRHPSELIAPEKIPGYLTTDSERIRLLEQLGVGEMVIAAFDERFRHLTPEAFLRFIVCGILGARAVFVGHDFRFGVDQTGDSAYLTSAAERYDFEVHVMDPIVIDGKKAGSSRIRELLRDGKVEKAARVLGRNYSVTGVVVKGDQLGRDLGFPTANLDIDSKRIIPADGIYAVLVRRGNDTFMGACSIGFRPTIGGAQRTIEVFILDFDGDVYDEALEIAFVARLREERKFDSLESLVDQIGVDVSEARRILASAYQDRK